MPVVVTVTRPGVTVTSTSTSTTSSSTVSAGTIAGIVIGTLVGGILLITLVLYLLNRYSRPKFTRVVNPAHDPITPSENLTYLPKRKPSIKTNARHFQRPSVSSEPLIPPISFPPLQPHAHSPGTSPLSDASAISHSTVTATLDIPLHEQISRLGRSDTSPDVAQATLDDARLASQNMFVHRMLQSRARASADIDIPPSRRPSLDVSLSRSSTPSTRPEQERLLVEAERTALYDAEMAHRGRTKVSTRDDDMESNESSYSQLSAPADHMTFLTEPSFSGQNGVSLARRKSSRRRRTPALPELPPVAEVSDAPSSAEERSQSQSILSMTAANPSVDMQMSHGTGSRPMSSVLDPSGPMPLLTSANFGKDSSASGTPPGSISSTTGWASSNSRASRYPSLAASSAGQSSRSGPRSDGGTDWHHPPSGLAGLATLQIGPLMNPHSPVEEQPEEVERSRGAPPVDGGQVKRARLREGTSSSIPEVERRSVMQGGIARIDVTL